MAGKKKSMHDLNVNDLELSSNMLPCGYLAITAIWNGKFNPNITSEYLNKFNNAMSLMAVESVDDRLCNNYVDNLKLSDQFLYTMLWDTNKNMPALMTGAQIMGYNAVRLYSRYYIFKEYRITGLGDPRTTDKLDNFEIIDLHSSVCEKYFKYLFISRDRGSSAFKKFKMLRPDIFYNWHVIKNRVEVKYPDNWQGCVVKGLTTETEHEFITAIGPD